MSNKKIRIYPIRTTRNQWNIKLYRYHNCSDQCKINIIEDSEYPDEILLITNPSYKDGKCDKYNKIEPTLIRLVDFSPHDNSIGEIGTLFNSNSKVIPDNLFTISISYPMSYVFEIVIRSTTGNGFTLKDVITYIKILYEFIYAEEERTATPQNYQLKKKCNTCQTKDILKYIEHIRPLNDTECCICCCEYGEAETVSKLPCKHIFHDDCISRWFLKSGTCPVCRNNVFECEHCDGSGIINYQFIGTVIPFENRDGYMTRNLTNGTFGIYNSDIEDLFIESLKYNRLEKRMHINIIS